MSPTIYREETMIHPITRIQLANTGRKYGFKAFKPTQLKACAKFAGTHQIRANNEGEDDIRIVRYGNDPRDVRIIVNTVRQGR